MENGTEGVINTLLQRGSGSPAPINKGSMISRGYGFCGLFKCIPTKLVEKTALGVASENITYCNTLTRCLQQKLLENVRLLEGKSQMEVSLNDVPVSTSTTIYPFRTYIENHMN